MGTCPPPLPAPRPETQSDDPVVMTPLDARKAGTRTGGASFSLTNRIFRVVWGLGWLVLARWTPQPLHGWRRFVLRLFGAQIGRKVRIAASVQIWHPHNLRIDEFAIIGPQVRLYNQGDIHIGRFAVVSQLAHICASTHDVNDRHFQIVLRPVHIEDEAWVAAEAFIGPGVRVGQGAIAGARCVVFEDLEPWMIYRGNPGVLVKRREFRDKDEL